MKATVDLINLKKLLNKTAGTIYFLIALFTFFIFNLINNILKH